MADEYQPMTAAELAAIRQRTEREARVFAMVYWPEFPSPQAYRDITALLADAAYWRGQVEQAAERMCAVEAENAELREIVRAVAKGPTACGIIPIAHICNFCDVPIGGLFARTDHRANCPVTKARAVLAAAKAAQTEAGGVAGGVAEMSDLEARCRNCGNTGVDMFGKPCVCRYGKALPGLLDTIRNLRTNGTPEGIAEAIKRAGEAQLAAHIAAGGEIPPTIREMEQTARNLSMLKMNMTSYVLLHQAHELAVRQNELYEAMQIVEQCGASPELTEAVVRLGNRLRHIQTDLASAVREAAGWRE